ncbi:MAG: retroviral-like aspartic protease family protein [Sphingomonas sp.]
MTILRLALMLSSSLAAAAGATVPLSVAETGHVTVPVTIDGKGPFQFVIDSGAEGTAVYARFADEQRLATAPSSETLVGQTGTADVALVPLRTLALDGFVSRDISAVRLADRGDGLALDGIVGLDVLGDKTVDFDFRRRRVSLRADIAGRPRPGGIAATRMLGGLLAIPVEVNGARGLAVIDTGARETRVNHRFAQAAGLVADAGQAGGTIYGATNAAVEMASARTRDVTFAGVTLRDRSIRIVDLPVFAQFGLADRPAMLLGADYLADQRMVIDFRDGRVWMK